MPRGKKGSGCKTTPEPQIKPTSISKSTATKIVKEPQVLYNPVHNATSSRSESPIPQASAFSQATSSAGLRTQTLKKQIITRSNKEHIHHFAIYGEESSISPRQETPDPVFKVPPLKKRNVRKVTNEGHGRIVPIFGEAVGSPATIPTRQATPELLFESPPLKKRTVPTPTKTHIQPSSVHGESLTVRDSAATSTIPLRRAMSEPLFKAPLNKRTETKVTKPFLVERIPEYGEISAFAETDYPTKRIATARPVKINLRDRLFTTTKISREEEVPRKPPTFSNTSSSARPTIVPSMQSAKISAQNLLYLKPKEISKRENDFYNDVVKGMIENEVEKESLLQNSLTPKLELTEEIRRYISHRCFLNLTQVISNGVRHMRRCRRRKFTTEDFFKGLTY